MKFLLDTNFCIAVMRGHAGAVAALKVNAPEACALSAVTLYELSTGVEKCQYPERERGKVARLLTVIRVLPFGEEEAKHAASVRAKLEAAGNVCGPYDLLIAGHALARGLTVVTHNVSEFSRVEGLGVEDWTK